METQVVRCPLCQRNFSLSEASKPAEPIKKTSCKVCGASFLEGESCPNFMNHPALKPANTEETKEEIKAPEVSPDTEPAAKIEPGKTAKGKGKGPKAPEVSL